MKTQPEDNLWVLVLSFYAEVSGIELIFSGLAANALMCWLILLVQA